MFRKTVLDNGIRIVTEKMSCVQSVSIGLWVNIGSRDEEPDEHGMSHFLEHMFFKGTRKRTAKEIALEIDEIGGELNAFTSHETTTFYAKVLDEHIVQAVGLLSDNFHDSQFEPNEIEKERQVVIEEIKMVEDDPEDLVHELYAEDVWKGSPLGRPILGTTDTVLGITRKKIIHFLKRTYDPHEIIISVAGHFNDAALMKLLRRAFENYTANEATPRPRVPPTLNPHFQVKQRKLEQIHLCLGTQGLPQNHPDRYVLAVINTVLGGSVSSRLFQEIRERRGLVYSIYSHLSSYQDGGLVTVYAGTSIQNAPKVAGLILKELKKLKEKGIGPDELEKAKNHIKGGIMLNMESTSSRMSKLAKDEIYFGRHFPLKEIVGEIDKVSVAQVMDLARLLFDTKNLSLTALGKIDPSTLLPQGLAL